MAIENIKKSIRKMLHLWSKTNRFVRLLIIFIIVESKYFPGGKVGFYCGDPALSHPYMGDTITWKWLFGLSILLPLTVLLVVERIWHGQAEKAGQSKQQALLWFKEYMYGFLINLNIIELMKTIIGSPRPHFFDTCSPIEATTCKDMEYVSQYSCSKAGWLTQSDRSFPSGHAALGLYAALFIAHYMRVRMHVSGERVRTCAWCVCMIAAAWCGSSRVLDRRHHWWDVLAGLAIGLLVLLYTIHSLCENFNCSNSGSKVVNETCSVTDKVKPSATTSTHT